MPTLDIRATGIRESGKGLDALGRAASDLTPFWFGLARDLANLAQERWPLRRRTARLRKSLTWRGAIPGPRRRVRTDANPGSAFGSAVFYARFHQHGARNVPRRELIHVNPARHTAALASWLVARAHRGPVRSAGRRREVDQAGARRGDRG